MRQPLIRVHARVELQAKTLNCSGACNDTSLHVRLLRRSLLASQSTFATREKMDFNETSK